MVPPLVEIPNSAIVHKTSRRTLIKIWRGTERMGKEDDPNPKN